MSSEFGVSTVTSIQQHQYEACRQMSNLNNSSSSSAADAVGQRIAIFRISKVSQAGSLNEVRKALVIDHDPNTEQYLIKFDDDGREEKVILSLETYKWIHESSGNVKKEIKSEPTSIFSEQEKKTWIGKRFEYTTRKGKRKIYDIKDYDTHSQQHHALCQATKKVKKIQMDMLSGFTWVVTNSSSGEDVNNISTSKHVKVTSVNKDNTPNEFHPQETNTQSKSEEASDVQESAKLSKCEEVTYASQRDTWNKFALAFDQEAMIQSKSEEASDVQKSAKSSKCEEVTYASQRDTWNKFALAFDQEARKQSKSEEASDVQKNAKLSKCEEVTYASQRDAWNKFALAFDQEARKQAKIKSSKWDEYDMTEEEETEKEIDSEYEEEANTQSPLLYNEIFREDKASETNKRNPLTFSTVSPIEGSNGLKGEYKHVQIIFIRCKHGHNCSYPSLSFLSKVLHLNKE